MELEAVDAHCIHGARPRFGGQQLHMTQAFSFINDAFRAFRIKLVSCWSICFGTLASQGAQRRERIKGERFRESNGNLIVFVKFNEVRTAPSARCIGYQRVRNKAVNYYAMCGVTLPPTQALGLDPCTRLF